MINSTSHAVSVTRLATPHGQDVTNDHVSNLFGLVGKAIGMATIPAVVWMEVMPTFPKNTEMAELTTVTLGALSYGLGMAMQAAARNDFVPGPGTGKIAARTPDANYFPRFLRCLSPFVF